MNNNVSILGTKITSMDDVEKNNWATGISLK